eukprot:gene3408-3898_t
MDENKNHVECCDENCLKACCRTCHETSLKFVKAASHLDKGIQIYSIKQPMEASDICLNVNNYEENDFNNEDDVNSITDTIITNAQPVCKICLEQGNEELFTPCKCDGSSKYVHESCLLKWFQKTRRKKCEICLSKVNIKSVGCKPMRKWRIPKGTYNFVFYFYMIYTIATFCTSGIALSVAITERCISPTCVALYIACVLSILSLVYCAGFTIYIKLFWKAAVTNNKNWRVYDRVSFHKTDRSQEFSRDLSSEEENGNLLRDETPNCQNVDQPDVEAIRNLVDNSNDCCVV